MSEASPRRYDLSIARPVDRTFAATTFLVLLGSPSAGAQSSTAQRDLDAPPTLVSPKIETLPGTPAGPGSNPSSIHPLPITKPGTPVGPGVPPGPSGPADPSGPAGPSGPGGPRGIQ
jgi:hypothetical protein